MFVEETSGVSAFLDGFGVGFPCYFILGMNNVFSGPILIVELQVINCGEIVSGGLFRSPLNCLIIPIFCYVVVALSSCHMLVQNMWP